MLAILGTLGVLAVLGVLFWIDELDKPLPPPQDDPRDWQGAFMKDWKRR